MRVELKKKFVQISVPILALLAAAALVNDVAGFLGLIGVPGIPVPTHWNWVVWVLAIVAAICWLAVTTPLLRNGIKFVRWFATNVWLMLFGHSELHQKVKELHRVYSAHVFASLTGLDESDPTEYSIIFTHKPDATSHAARPGPGDQYRIPGFPYDEAESIMRLWFQVAQTLRFGVQHIRPLCSCTCKSGDTTSDRSFEKHSFAIIGSPKGNHVCEEYMRTYSTFIQTNKPPVPLSFTMQISTATDNDKSEYCYLRAESRKHGDLTPSQLPPLGTNRRGDLIDYAIFARLPNLLMPGPNAFRHTTLLIAGCRVAGQVALSDWMFDTANLARINKVVGNDYFCVVFKVYYTFVRGSLPQIHACKTIHVEKIVFSDQELSDVENS